MKQLVCEMCGSTDLMKDGGVFVCQSCGCKYSVEEARKMMVEGTVDVQGTVKIDSSGSVQNYIDLARSAIEAANGESAIEYANKALEIAPKNCDAWLVKMDAIKLVATFGDLKLKEMLEAGKNAISFAESEEKKAELEENVYGYFLSRSLELLKLAMTQFADTADIQDTFKTFSKISILSAASNTMKVDKQLIDLYESIASQGQALPSYVPDEALVKYDGFAKLVGECGKQYRFATDALIKRYKIYGAELLDSAKKVREKNAQDLEDRSKAAIEKRKAAYFESNPEAQAKLAELDAEIAKCDKSIESMKAQISRLEGEIKSLGLFKSKEKAPLQAKVGEIKKDITAAEKKKAAVLEEKSHLGE